MKAHKLEITMSNFEEFSDLERSILSRYFTNLDEPVFALVNLPEVVKGALFARYSRSSKSLRRLFLDEFVGDLDVTGDVSIDATMGLERAEKLYEKVFFEYGDDSVAQLGGVHLACEGASNLLTKILERGRLMSYLEQSTRYIAYNERLLSGHYRYYRCPSILDSPYGARYIGTMDRLFDCYSELLTKLTQHLTKNLTKPKGSSDFAFRQAIRAKALDSLRGLLPAASLSNVGIYGTGQAFEMLILRMRASELVEAREYAESMLVELRKVIPSFLSRIDREDRGLEWVKYYKERNLGESLAAESINEIKSSGSISSDQANVKLLKFDEDGETNVLAQGMFKHLDLSLSDIKTLIKDLTYEEKRLIMRDIVGDRKNRRHRPSRSFEATSYDFEVISDYGAFRDLQRHRMLNLEWQTLNCNLGYDIPDLVEEAQLSDAYIQSMERSKELYIELKDEFLIEAPYVLPLGFKIRYLMSMNAREAMHIIELRSQVQGHASYRKIAQEMHRQIDQVAGHHLIAEAMSFVQFLDPDLERLDSENRNQRRKLQA